ncbi:TonB-dependent receptor domain-containing protein [Sphingomonas sp. LaA6.9]|uniref:TonB-dependent receptor domain-containing protein n=1 Tax=Sphingomonas sp. LaA6.9 TaxID=2919914 RepID=UPI001F4FF91C|nr:TonB-dependent receptor [Sphingomonas sp. LaA6.9]MCJ8158999.1 TonB-dependent receptor [Sphingomonas sp. LaA6.9]
MKIRVLLLSAVSISAVIPTAAFAEQAGSTSENDIIVTATGLDQEADETATPVVTLSGDELVHRRQATLGDTLAGQPGINVDNFGGGASRPVVRGQTAPRVQALSDGANIQDASTISPDHAITTEPLLLRGIEVLRGPAALLYGGGAIGGAINLLDDKVPTALPEDGFSGVAEGRLGTADDERSLVGGITAGAGPFAFHAEGVHRSSNDYRVPGKYGQRHVDGSYNDTSTFSVGGSWIGPDGYLGVAYTRQRSEYGLPGHNHEYESCHPHGSSLHCGAHDHDEAGHDHDHDHEHDEVPFVKLRSERFDIRSEYGDPLPGFEKLKFRMSFTDYGHDEIEEDEVATTFRNEAHDIRFELTHKPIGGLRGVFGVQHSESQFSALGTEAFLPESETRNTALFLIETLQAGAVRFELAARQEWQKIETTRNREVSHRPFSISGAAVWDIGNDYSLALSLARSQRAPNVQELYARGIHLATNTYELGTATLGKETDKSIDLTFRKRAGGTTFTIGAYHQDFDNYIFANTLDRFEDFRLIRYTAADANFTGIDGEMRHQFAPDFGASIFGDYVRAKLKNNLGNLPRIPAGRLGARADGKWGPFSADIEYYHVFEQGKIASFETPTSGYDMVNATVAYRLDLGPKANAELFVRATNLTNDLAFNHASFIKDASPLRGRNFTFGLRTAF